ncbi:class A beta-lactamase-related serine hydrolase [Nocardia sp. CDC159]|uniref:Class A beta-lactamase-related serine hydrolase n=1 Tax=Nocardia pulmonis TaxID=2951408 RepID=A0A9X2E1W5_9NOCA|nr:MULTISPECIES: serine hydrolase [Nocardia]MCM6772086.1 class A beta-lactamase-related serine hydrolase [Nocardia pulmonis]MCM6785256.1 class A beta-lactamase-related serine hydrolase [Nocardia sp. CDC159]
MLSICAVRSGEDPFYAINSDVPHEDCTHLTCRLDHRAHDTTHRVTAAGLAHLMLALPADELSALGPGDTDDLAVGMPAGTRIAGGHGRSRRMRHAAALVTPPDAPPYALAVCYTGPLANGRATGDPATRLLARIAAQVWSLRRG